MVMVWPIAFAKSARPTPSLRNQAGGLLSHFQFSIATTVPFASMKTTICGLIQSTFVTVPVNVKRLDISKMAEGEWCAQTDPAAPSIMSAIRPTESLFFKENSPFALWGEYITQARTRSLSQARKQALRNHRVHALGAVY